MRREPIDAKDAAERTVRDIRRRTRKQHSAEEKIRIVLAGRGVSHTPSHGENRGSSPLGSAMVSRSS